MKIRNKMQRMWVLYGLFFGIVLFCLVLFLCNIVSTEDDYHMDDLERQFKKEKSYGLIISDLGRTDNLYKYDIPIYSNEKREINARINTYDIMVRSDDKSEVSPKQINCVMVLQGVAIVSLLAICVLVVVLLISFFKAIKQGRVFHRRSVALLWIIGILMIVMSLSLDTATYIERNFAYQVLANTDWAPMHEYTIHITRLFFGLIVLFAAELLHIGYGMQEEQDLTI